MTEIKQIIEFHNKNFYEFPSFENIPREEIKSLILPLNFALGTNNWDDFVGCTYNSYRDSYEYHFKTKEFYITSTIFFFLKKTQFDFTNRVEIKQQKAQMKQLFYKFGFADEIYFEWIQGRFRMQKLKPKILNWKFHAIDKLFKINRVDFKICCGSAHFDISMGAYFAEGVEFDPEFNNFSFYIEGMGIIFNRFSEQNDQFYNDHDVIKVMCRTLSRYFPDELVDEVYNFLFKNPNPNLKF